ncbi:MAG: DUF3383 family protein [Psychroserpens sp.]|nr:DUF3383 family protein [Psychroserpens sp.]
MANPINEIVDVQISRETLALDEADFNTMMFVTNEQVFAERSRKYYDDDDLIADGFSSNGSSYKAANAFFSQSPRPVQMVVSKRQATEVHFELLEADVKNSTEYKIVVTDNAGASLTAAFTSASDAEDDKAAAIANIYAGLETQATSAGITGLADATTHITLTINSTTNETVTISGGLQYVEDGGTYEDWATHKTAQEAYDNLWYVMTAYSHLEADQLAIANVIESEYKLYLTSSSNAANKLVIPSGSTATSGDIAGKLEELNYDRSAVIPKADADDKFIECAVCGKKLTSVPGATTWMYTVLNGQSADQLSASESQAIRAKNANVYENINGVAMLREGTVASGEFIDIMRGSDELRNRIQLEVFRALVVTANAGSKHALDDEDVASLVNIVESELQRSVENKFILGQVITENDAGQDEAVPGYFVETDLVSSLPANQRANRQAPDIRFAAKLSNAVHKSVIRGVLTV